MNYDDSDHENIKWTLELIECGPSMWRNMTLVTLVIIGSGDNLPPDRRKPLPEPMLIHCKLDPSEHTLMKIFCMKIQNILLVKRIWKFYQQNVRRLVQG